MTPRFTSVVLASALIASASGIAYAQIGPHFGTPPGPCLPGFHDRMCHRAPRVSPKPSPGFGPFIGPHFGSQTRFRRF